MKKINKFGFLTLSNDIINGNDLEKWSLNRDLLHFSN